MESPQGPRLAPKSLTSQGFDEDGKMFRNRSGGADKGAPPTFFSICCGRRLRQAAIAAR